MEKIFLLLLSFQIVQGQVIEPSSTKSTQVLFDYHTTIQKKKKTTAWIMLGSGILLTAVGLGINTTDEIAESMLLGLAEVEDVHKGDWMIYLGSASTLASIPFFISADKHKRKATLSLKGEQNIVDNIKIDNSTCLTLNITIPF